MPKIIALKNVKHGAKSADRHAPARPVDDAALWARTLTTQRVARLFRTLDGLDNHWLAIQGEVNAGNHHFFVTEDRGWGYNDGGKTTREGKDLIKFIRNAIIKAAKAARFDFPQHQMNFTRDTGWLKLTRDQGIVRAVR